MKRIIANGLSNPKTGTYNGLIDPFLEWRMELSNETALITGATSGIGAEAARIFARQGAMVLVTGRQPLLDERTDRASSYITGTTLAGDGGRTAI
jgi:NAD(P)-dependent dehydrogenase (short-subunit alcohol dehydrogenase family)